MPIPLLHRPLARFCVVAAHAALRKSPIPQREHSEPRTLPASLLSGVPGDRARPARPPPLSPEQARHKYLGYPVQSPPPTTSAATADQPRPIDSPTDPTTSLPPQPPFCPKTNPFSPRSLVNPSHSRPISPPISPPMSAQQSDFWSPSHYSTHAAFVPVLTSNIVTLLDPKQDERIFDLGCGDGVLTQELVTRFGARVVGTDSSPAMIEAARAKAAAAGIDESRLRYDVVDGQRLEEDIGDSYKGPYDAVFSNAAIHWMKQDPEAVVRGVRQLLRPGGRFVAEFGGHLNVATIHSALIAAVGRRGKDGVELSPWFFPTADEYKTILERNGFEVESIGLFPRQTDLPTDVGGWVDTFGAPFLKPFSEAEAAQIRHEVVEQLRPVLCDKNGKWVVDYVRLRVRATLKP